MDPATIEAGPDLDRVIAERVMGWAAGPEYGDEKVCVARFRSDGAVEGQNWKRWSPSTDIVHAWEVVGRMRDRWTVQIRGDGDDNWCVTFRTAGVHHAKAPTAPLAICRAALSAVVR